jgi:eukaryotic-like serine/threonine-protein kinase
MASTTTTADASNHLDPWGFGRVSADDAASLVEFFEPTIDGDARPARRPRDVAAPWPRPVMSAAPLGEPPTVERVAGDGSSSDALPRQMLGVLAVFALVIVAQAFYIGFSLVGTGAHGAAAELVVSSHPTGAQVLVDGRVEGTTPVAIAVPVGAHLVEVLGPTGVPEPFNVNLTEGQRWVQHVTLTQPAARGVDAHGTLRVDTGRALAQITIDGELAGSTPLEHTQLRAGDHLIRAVFSRGGAVERRVTIGAGQTLALVLEAPAGRSSAPAGPVSGWVHVDAPFPVQIFEGGSLVGTSDSERVMMSAGGHVLELVNATLGYRVLGKVVVTPGAVTPLAVEVPKAAVHVNAQPWAEVSVDGRSVGETPLANLLLPLGSHEVVFTHPDLGRRAQTITVKAAGVNRVSVDLRR